MSNVRFSRRKMIAGFASLAAASPRLRGQQPLAGEPPGRITPRDELVNVFECEAVAQRKLASTEYSSISGSDRTAFDRITFRPRMMVNAMGLDLTTELFGEKMFAPILVGPTSHQQRYHPEGELATVRGASAAKAVMVVSSRSSVPLDKIAAEAKTPLWYQVFPEPDIAPVRSRIQNAVKAGCKAIVITVGTPYQPAGAAGTPNPAKLAVMADPAINWSVIDQLRQGSSAPIVLKGIMSPEEAQIAVQRGVQGIVVSNHGGRFTPGLASPIEMLPAIADAVGGKIPLLIDGSFRRGTDMLKALALGARAILLGRPPLWGLAAYGAEGVQTVMEMLQTELARNMAMCGKPTIKDIDRSAVKIHKA